MTKNFKTRHQNPITLRSIKTQLFIRLLCNSYEMRNHMTDIHYLLNLNPIMYIHGAKEQYNYNLFY